VDKFLPLRLRVLHFVLREVPALLGALGIAACGSLPTPLPLPPTEWIRLQISPTLANQTELFSTCTPPGFGLAVQQAGGVSFTAGQTDLILQWGAPEPVSGFASILGTDSLTVVVHPDNPATSLSLDALLTTYAGKLPAWDWDYLGQNPAPLTAYAYSPTLDIQRIFNSAWPTAPSSLNREVVLVPGPAEMRTTIATDRSALGFLPSTWVDSSVKPIRIDSTPPSWQKQPILAISALEPQDASRAFLLCVQQGLEP